MGTNEIDKTTEYFKELFDQWIDLVDKSDQEIVNVIQDQEIDILIDLTGLWSSNRANIFNTRISISEEFFSKIFLLLNIHS